MPLVLFGVKEQSNLRWLVVQRIRRSSPRSADAPLARGLSSQCKITNYALDLLGHNMLNEQRQNDYTAIAPTSLLVAGVRALALDAGNRQVRVRSVFYLIYIECCCFQKCKWMRL
jgi:hypothetical protein